MGREQSSNLPLVLRVSLVKAIRLRQEEVWGWEDGEGGNTTCIRAFSKPFETLYD